VITNHENIVLQCVYWGSVCTLSLVLSLLLQVMTSPPSSRR